MIKTKKPENDKGKAIQIYSSVNRIKKVDSVAKSMNVSRSAIIANAVDEYIKNHPEL